MSLIRSKISSIITNISNVTGQPTLVNDAIQVALDRVYQWYDWPYYMDSKNGVIKLIADYNTGTAKVTNGSTTVTGVGTSWTSAMVGRKFRKGSDKAYYRISAIGGGTSLTLDNNYQGTTDSTGGTYEIFKDEYRLNADVDKYKTIRQIQNGVAMFSLTPYRFDEILPTPQNFADPIYEILVGTNLDTSTTGTLSSTGSTITGVGTAWTSVEGLGRNSKIRIGSLVYTVKSVDSDTQITTYETIGTTAASTAYEIKLNNLIVQVYHIPNTASLLYYRYFRIPETLANDYDLPDMPYEFHWILVDGALSWIWRQKGDLSNQTDAENRFITGLQIMKQKLGTFAPNRITCRRSTDRLRRRFDGIENSNYDYRFSSPL